MTRSCLTSLSRPCALRRAPLLAAAVVALGGTPVGSALAQVDKPRWELGVGLATAQLNQYRGSNENVHYATPFPFFVYRGDVLKADREGARLEFFSVGETHVDVGLGFANPVSSQRSTLRAGMPNVPGLIDIGPAMDTTLYRSEGDHIHVKFRLPVGYGIKLGQQHGPSGWQASPRLTVEVRDVLSQPGWNWLMQTGPLFATRARHSLYYNVDAAYATAQRPAFQSSGGYSGTQLTMSLNKRFERFWVGAYVRHDWLAGAAFVNSPLVRSRDYNVVGLAAAWVFSQSSELVKVD